MSKIITIIPAYNTPLDWYTDAVLSIARQNTTHEQILIIVDDGSEKIPIQITPKIKKGLVENPLLTYSLVRHRTNKSVGAALNTGIKYAQKRDPLFRYIGYKCLQRYQRTGENGTDQRIFRAC